MLNRDSLFKKMTEAVAETDFSGYTIQYPPMFAWKTSAPPPQKEILNAWRKALRKKSHRLGIYIHIPFCKQRCSFCRYFSVESDNNSLLEKYLSALQNEMKIYKQEIGSPRIRTLYFGGGTPSLLTIRQLNKIFENIIKNFNLSHCRQIAFEGNPDFLDLEKLKLIKRWGVNRLTIGVQSLDPKVIHAVGRYQQPTSFPDCFRNSRKAGIKHINVDLMAGLPKQTLRSFHQTLRTVINFNPDLIHVHPFYPTSLSQFTKQGRHLSKNEMDLRMKMALASKKIIHEAGYEQTKYDSDGKTSDARNIQLSDAVEYNSPFLGLGAGAVSHITGFFRYANAPSIDGYIGKLDKDKLPIFSGISLNEKDEMIYFITASLRYGGVKKRRFKNFFNKNIDEIFKEELGYLSQRGKIQNAPTEIMPLFENIGEYMIFSKYFYSDSLIESFQRSLRHHLTNSKMKKEEMKYILL